MSRQMEQLYDRLANAHEVIHELTQDSQKLKEHVRLSVCLSLGVFFFFSVSLILVVARYLSNLYVCLSITLTLCLSNSVSDSLCLIRSI